MTTPHAGLFAAALRDDDHAVRAYIATLDGCTAERLRLSCLLITVGCWDHVNDLAADRWRQRLQGEAA